MGGEVVLRDGLELARLAKATYVGPINQTHYYRHGSKLIDQIIVHGSLGRGYCRIFWNETSTVIAFRGTRGIADWAISNLRAFPVPIRDCNLDSIVLVHRGFQRTLDYGDKSTDLRSLDAIFEFLQRLKLLDRRISVTGHSLSAALALLFAVKFRARYPSECEKILRKLPRLPGRPWG